MSLLPCSHIKGFKYASIILYENIDFDKNIVHLIVIFAKDLDIASLKSITLLSVKDNGSSYKEGGRFNLRINEFESKPDGPVQQVKLNCEIIEKNENWYDEDKTK